MDSQEEKCCVCKRVFEGSNMKKKRQRLHGESAEKEAQVQSCQVSCIRRDSHTLDKTLTLSRLTCRNEVKSHT